MPEYFTRANPDWDRFLTDTDRALLATTRWAKDEPFGLGSRPVLLIVDAYYGALGRERVPILEAVEEWPAACGLAGWDAIDRMAPLLGLARKVNIPVVYLTGQRDNPDPWNRKKRKSRMNPEGFQIVDEVAPHQDDLVLEKCSPSGFATTSLNALLTDMRCDTLLVCGETTSGCVRATVVDACVLGYAVGVIADCCFDRLEASHWTSLFDMDQKYADVLEMAPAERYLEDIRTRVS